MLQHTETRITSDETGHTATRVGANAWSVSWLPGPPIARCQAVAAIQLAQAVVRLQEHPDTHAQQRQLWALIDECAAALEMPGVDAATLVALMPFTTEARAVA
ncbi:hypothetical protein [Sciscionella sediminilitoris]|uniref:hypothetical protein n=1 Tax=Sciscionella sediminilitoris TaxID=1445613 RepID=UPI00055BB19E|nr:hypothetical protein [Sciscionella sp. SE31]